MLEAPKSRATAANRLSIEFHRREALYKAPDRNPTFEPGQYVADT